MQRPIRSFGVVLIALGIIAYCMLWMNLKEKHRKEAEVAVQIGTPGMAPDANPSVGELFDFKRFGQMEGLTPILAYSGVVLVAGGLVCLVGSMALGRAKSPPAPPR